MAVLELPLRSDVPRFDFIQTLDGVAYKFLFAWNTRDSSWYFSLFLEDDTPVFLGVKVVVNWPLNRRRSSVSPPGMFRAVDARNLDENPGLTDLGKRVRVLYFDADSLATMTAELGIT